MAEVTRKVGRKILIASLGVASVSYVACTNSSTSRPVVDAAADAGGRDGAGDSTLDAAGDSDALDGGDDRQIIANLVPLFNDGDTGGGTQGG